jgi:hypothetical protein
MTHKKGHNVESQNGAVWEWNPGAKPINRITSQFPTLPVDGVQRGEQEAAAEGLTGIKTPDQSGFSMADIMNLFGSRSSKVMVWHLIWAIQALML